MKRMSMVMNNIIYIKEQKCGISLAVAQAHWERRTPPAAAQTT